MTTDLRKLALTGIIHELAEDNIGIYPKAVTGGEHPYEKRSDWQEGWNACAMRHSELIDEIDAWMDAVPEFVKDMLLSKQVALSVQREGISLYVNCSDTFFWGCSDAEDITIDQLPELQECYRLSPKYGGELWACRQRHMRPQKASYVECYPQAEWPLFDAAGPPRDDPDGRR